MEGFLRLNRGLMRMPAGWRLWLVLLMLANLVAPLFFLGHLEAWVVLGTFLAAGALMGFLCGVFGFTRILGLAHFLWIPLLVWLGTRLGEIPDDTAFGLWLRVLIGLDALSLVIDLVDVGRYLAGDRDEVVEGL